MKFTSQNCWRPTHCGKFSNLDGETGARFWNVLFLCLHVNLDLWPLTMAWAYDWMPDYAACMPSLCI